MFIAITNSSASCDSHNLGLIYTELHVCLRFGLFFSHTYTEKHFTSLHLLPSQFPMPFCQVLPICSRGKHDENASLVVHGTDGQSRALLMTGSAGWSFYCLYIYASSNKRADSACHINNSPIKVKFFYLKCVCGREIGKTGSEKDIKGDSRQKLYIKIDV